MRKGLLALLLLPMNLFGTTHPRLLNTKADWPAMISSSTIHPWSDVVAAATTYLNGPQATGAGSYDCTHIASKFGTGSDGVRQQNENAFMNLMGSYALEYVLNTGTSGSTTWRNKITCLMDQWPAMRADQPVSDGYNLADPMNSAFMSMTIALDEIHDDLTSTQISTYETMMDSWVAYSRTVPSSWALNNYGAYSTYDLYRDTDSAQLIVDTQCYHAALLGNDSIYPPAICGNRQAYRLNSSELQIDAQLNVDGISGSGASYAWARIGGDVREKQGKWGGNQVLTFTGTDSFNSPTKYSTVPPLKNFFEWLFAGMMTPWATKVVFGDTANNQSIGGDKFQGLAALYGVPEVFLIPHGYLGAGIYSKRAADWANRSIQVTTTTVVYPGELIDYAGIISADTTSSQPIVSMVVPHGGAAFWDEDQSTSALMGVLDNYHITKNDHYHASDFNGLFLAGYGETLLSNVGVGAAPQNGVLGFSHYWHRDNAHSGNVLLMGDVNFANDTTGSYDPNDTYNNFNPGTPFVGNTSIALYGADGISESLLSDKFDYAVGLATSPYVWYSTQTGVITQVLGSNNRNFLFVHPDTTGGVQGYWIVDDEVMSSSYPTVNQVWHPYGVDVTTVTPNQEYLWNISPRAASNSTQLDVFLASPPQSVAMSSSPFSATPTSFVGTYINGTYAVTSSSAHVVTVLYPGDSQHSLATISRISSGEAEGATVLSNATTDYVLASNGATSATMGGASFVGKIGFVRKDGTGTRQYFVKQGTSFNDGAGTRTGFSSVDPITLHMNGLHGTSTSAASTSVTMFCPRIRKVTVDGADVAGTRGTNQFTFTLSAGTHDILNSLITLTKGYQFYGIGILRGKGKLK